MDRTPSIDELRNKAFRLAYFILDNRSAALRAAMSAMEKLQVASSAQDKRLYYTPTGRAASRPARNKVSLTEIQLLQRLVYIECEFFEKMEEQSASLLQRDMLIRFVKHLVRITLRRNSFYVSLGTCRLLYDYSTAQTREIYGLIVQDPDRAKEDYYYRSRKRRLIEEVTHRFGKMLKTHRGHRGEERFETQETSAIYRDLVKECLTRFTPWYSPCVLPADLNLARNTIPPLSFEGSDPDEEHVTELNRMHTLLHPPCFSRVVLGLGFDSPDERLQIPYFFLSRSGGPESGNRLNPPDLSEAELDDFKAESDNNSARRTNSSSGLLSIRVDGAERARFDLRKARAIQIDLDEGAELIEIRQMEPDGEALLAIHALERDEGGLTPYLSSVVLEGGQKLTFRVRTAEAGEQADSGGLVTIQYQETSLVRAASLFLQRLKSGSLAGTEPGPSGNRRTFRPVIGIAILIVAVAGLMAAYFYSRPVTPRPESAASEQTPNNPPESETPRSPSPASVSEDRPDRAEPAGPPQSEKPSSGNRRRGVAKIHRRPADGQQAPVAEDVEATRVLAPETASAALAALKRVYVDPLGTFPSSRFVRDGIVDAIRSSGRFVIVDNRDDAEAVFKGRIRTDRSRKVQVVLELVNAEGNVIWSLTPGSSPKQYSGSASVIADQIVRAFLEDVRRLEPKR